MSLFLHLLIVQNCVGDVDSAAAWGVATITLVFCGRVWRRPAEFFWSGPLFVSGAVGWNTDTGSDPATSASPAPRPLRTPPPPPPPSSGRMDGLGAVQRCATRPNQQPGSGSHPPTADPYISVGADVLGGSLETRRHRGGSGRTILE